MRGWGGLPGRGVDTAAAVGTGQQAAPASGKMVPLGDGGWHPATVIQLQSHASTSTPRCQEARDSEKSRKVNAESLRKTQFLEGRCAPLKAASLGQMVDSRDGEGVRDCLP